VTFELFIDLFIVNFIEVDFDFNVKRQVIVEKNFGKISLSTLSIQNGMVRALIWNIPYRSVGVKWLIDAI